MWSSSPLLYRFNRQCEDNKNTWQKDFWSLSSSRNALAESYMFINLLSCTHTLLPLHTIHPLFRSILFKRKMCLHQLQASGSFLLSWNICIGSNGYYYMILFSKAERFTLLAYLSYRRIRNAKPYITKYNHFHRLFYYPCIRIKNGGRMNEWVWQINFGWERCRPYVWMKEKNRRNRLKPNLN